jgi:hypothetical protein
MSKSEEAPMNCSRFESLLEALLDDRLPAPEREAMRVHAEGCARCAELRRLTTDGVGLDVERDAPDLTAAVLSRTAGTACERAHELLPEHADDLLGDTIDGDLLADHLIHCADCAGLDRALRMLRNDLPLQARLDPGDAFTAAVISRTSDRATLEWSRRLTGLWESWVKRPRFAWESAYVATAFLSVVLALQGTSLSAAPAAARDLVSLVRPERTAEGQAVWRVRLDELSQSAWQASAGDGLEQVELVRGTLEERVARTSAPRAALKEHGNELADAVTELDAKRGAAALRQLSGDVGSLVQNLIRGEERETEGSNEQP